MIWPGWDKQLAGAMGLELTHERARFLHAWARAEGGTARFNPLNTTMGVPGATDYNNVHVRHYPDALAGIAATLLTLRLHYYADVRGAIGAKGLAAEAIARRSHTGLSTWGTGVEGILGLLKTM